MTDQWSAPQGVGKDGREPIGTTSHGPQPLHPAGAHSFECRHLTLSPIGLIKSDCSDPGTACEKKRLPSSGFRPAFFKADSPLINAPYEPKSC